MNIEVVIDLIRLMLKYPCVIGVLMSMSYCEKWSILYIVLMVYQWIDDKKYQYPILFRALKYIYEFLKIVQICIQWVS